MNTPSSVAIGWIALVVAAIPAAIYARYTRCQSMFYFLNCMFLRRNKMIKERDKAIEEAAKHSKEKGQKFSDDIKKTNYSSSSSSNATSLSSASGSPLSSKEPSKK